MRDRLRRHWWVVGLAIAAVAVIVLAPLASPDPDGLTSVATQHGFLQTAHDALYSILPGYSVPGIEDPATGKVVSGLIGVGLVFLMVFGIGRLLRRRRAG